MSWRVARSLEVLRAEINAAAPNRSIASDGSIVGRSIEVDGVQHEVVGIAPPGFDFPMGAQIWAPLSFTAQNVANRRSLSLTGFGRLAPGRTLEEAKAQLAPTDARYLVSARVTVPVTVRHQGEGRFALTEHDPLLR